MKLTNIFEKASSKLHNDKIQRILYFLAPYVVIFCLVLGLLAYVNIIPGFAYYFYVGRPLGVAVRALSFFILFLYSILCILSLDVKPNYSLMIVFIILILLNGLMILVSPHHYETLYLSKYYSVGTYFITSVSDKSVFISFASSVVDFLWGFCFLWVLPQVFKNKRQLLFVIVFYILFGIFSCAYSFVKEADIFKLFFTDPNKIGSATGLKSFYDTKQSFGVFLCPAFCCSLVGLAIISKIDIKSLFLKITIFLFFIISAIIIFFVSFVSLCRTAIIGNILFLVIYYFGFVIAAFINKKWVLGSILSILLVLIVVLFIVFINVPLFHEKGIFKNLYDFIMKHILNRLSVSSDSRLAIVYAYINDIPVINLFFGLSKALEDIYIRSLAPILRYGLHSGFVKYLAEYGVISFFITYLLLIKIMWKNISNIKKDPVIVVSLFATFITAMFMNISEAEILVFSSSTIVFMFNFMILVVADSKYLQNYYFNYEKVKQIC